MIYHYPSKGFSLLDLNDNPFDFVVHVEGRNVSVDQGELAFQLLVQQDFSNVIDVDTPNKPRINIDLRLTSSLSLVNHLFLLTHVVEFDS